MVKLSVIWWLYGVLLTQNLNQSCDELEFGILVNLKADELKKGLT